MKKRELLECLYEIISHTKWNLDALVTIYDEFENNDIRIDYDKGIIEIQDYDYETAFIITVEKVK